MIRCMSDDAKSCAMYSEIRVGCNTNVVVPCLRDKIC
jgi:hypothetical protein